MVNLSSLCCPPKCQTLIYFPGSPAVTRNRGSFPLNLDNPVNFQARKLFNILQKAYSEKMPVQTMGSLDPVQMSQQAAAGGQVAYVSGWAASSE